MWGVDLNTIIHDKFFIMVLFLLALGAILKHRTKLDNNIIAVVLFAVAFPVLSSWGYLISTEATQAARLFEAIIWCGIMQGVVITALAAYGWDAGHGLWKYGALRKARKRERKEVLHDL